MTTERQRAEDVAYLTGPPTVTDWLPPPRLPAPPPPPSTLDELARVLRDYDRLSARSMQVAVGPSELAVECDRRLGYSLVGTPQRDDGKVKWAPLQGTAVHALLADALGADNRRRGTPRWLVEERVYRREDDHTGGSCDAYDLVTDTVIDWKVVGVTTLKRVKRHGPSLQYRGQIQLYGRGWERAGRTPRWVRIVFLARTATFAESFEWTDRYRIGEAVAVMRRADRIAEVLRELEVAAYPKRWSDVPDQPGPLCHWCPFYRPGAPPDGGGCPGDVEADARTKSRQAEGIIAPASLLERNRI